MNKQSAYILRQAPSGISQLHNISLPEDVIVNGWSGLSTLSSAEDYGEMREMLKKHYYSNYTNYRKAGYAAGAMWTFIHDMNVGDLIVVPAKHEGFYVAEIVSDYYYDSSKKAVEADSGHRRKVRWLNGKKPISRDLAPSRLFSRMKIQQTWAKANDLVEEVLSTLHLVAQTINGSEEHRDDAFFADLRKQLVATTLGQIQDGRMNERSFEKLICRLLLSLGARDARVIGRRGDKGIDVLGNFEIGGVTTVPLGVQVKYHRDQTDESALQQLVRGMEHEGIDVGWLVTSAQFSEGVESKLEEVVRTKNYDITLIDGETLCAMILSSGLDNITQQTL